MPNDHNASVETDVTCRYGTHAPRDCPARVFALSGTTPPVCPVPVSPPGVSSGGAAE